jgi:Ca2+-transporting ATPase
VNRAIPTAPPASWARDVHDVAASLQTDLANGLGDEEAAIRLGIVGPNELLEDRAPSPWRLFFSQFANTMTVVLGVAAVVTLLIGEELDTIAIAVILTLNAGLGFAEERMAERAMAALKQMTSTPTRIVRSGTLRDRSSVDLVPGDVVQIGTGDIVPGDLRLFDVHALRIDESALTGESEPAAKTDESLPDVDGSFVANRRNMAFKGTAVTYGRARGVVVATGMATEIGAIAELLRGEPAGHTPLQRRLAALGRRMAAAALVVVGILFVVGVATREPADEMFLTSVSLAVAAIPEGLPAVVTVSLALGARRMADRNAVIRRLPAVETLGSVTVICSDKTGTLTENRMTVERVWTPGNEYVIHGAGYGPDAEVEALRALGHDEYLDRAARVAAACNDAVLHPPAAPGDEWTITGDPTEGALKAFAARAGVDDQRLQREHPRAQEIAFDATRRRMTTVHTSNGGSWVAAKGALLAIAPLVDARDRELLAEAETVNDALARDGYRVLALAERGADVPPHALERPEHGLRLVGLVGIADPPRPEVADAIATCRDAGITVVMITGDDPRTAASIGERLELSGGDRLWTGTEVDALDEDEFADQVSDIRIYARTNPEQKLRIIDAWKDAGGIVAMTGDGVNDAPALRRADIGVAMGVTGTDVSKDAADMVLADDNFATIVHAVEEGRRIYDNIRRFVRYMLTTNIGELLVMFIAPLVGLPLPLLPLQILWINLVTDGLPAVALGFEPAEADVMHRRPRDPDESILAGGLWQHALWVGLVMAAVVIPLQAVTRAVDWPWQTIVFSTLAFLQLGHAFAVRSERESAVRLGMRTNPWITWAIALSVGVQLAVVYLPFLQRVFDTEPLDAAQLAVVAFASTAAFVAVEVEKWVRRRARTRL